MAKNVQFRGNSAYIYGMERKFWQNLQKIFFIGIGGVSMSGLAIYMLRMGFEVAGSDLTANAQTARVEKEGGRIFIGHSAANIEGAEAVIVNSAIASDNPELCAARGKGIPIYSRAELLGMVAGSFENTIGIAGCHGKTTATAMCAHVLEECSGSCSAHIGGEDAEYYNLYLGGEKYFVTEACEYKGNFLMLRPNVAVVLNTDSDHLDCYRDADALAEAYRMYVKRAQAAILCGEDKIAKEVEAALTFGLTSYCDVGAENIRSNGGRYIFNVRIRNAIFERVRLNVFGRHNIYNALAAIAVAEYYGYPTALSVSGLQKFHGIRRRFELLGECNGARFIADYAHHPKEIAAVLATAREVSAGRLFVVFQPHTYSRTRMLFEDFLKVLLPLENLVIYKTYAAREFFDAQGSALTLSESLPNSLYMDSLRQMKMYLHCTLHAGDTVLFLGAGDIYFIAKRLLAEDKGI